MDLGENEELREALLGPDGDDDLEFYITFPTPTALVFMSPISFFSGVWGVGGHIILAIPKLA
jgi:hypothetical protein